ncbi:MAG TPA: APC family permease [Candidatus Dormibacteraeota bacterium]|nr:APC family permease [Candidatus Dormibacteraeota bacterium]
MPVTDNPSLQQAEAEVQAHSIALRKELGLFDLVLAQLLIIIVADYMGTAVKAGASHVVFWILAIATFFVPQALVVIHLNRRLPIEGGLYEWARIAFNDQVGFLVAWNLWLYAIIYVGLGGLLTVSFVSYVIPGAAWIASSKGMIIAASFAMIASTMCVAGFGLGIGKWINNVGAAVFLITIAALIVIPFGNLWRGTLTEYHPLRLVAPPLTLFSLSVFSKMTFGALTGFEYVAVFAGECRDPKRHLPRSVWLAAPVVALVYILATSAILAFVAPSAEDVVAPIPQALSRGFHALGGNTIVMPLAVLFLLIYYLATFCAFFTVSTRLPMVAGWDHLLPEWFSRLHPRYKTPLNSVLFLGAATVVVATAALIGVGHEESFELLLTWSFTFYGIAYLALFAIPIFARKDRGLRPGMWVRIAAASGFLVTLLFVVLSVFPIIDVGSSGRYSVKIAGVVLGANLLGWMIYLGGQRKKSRTIN